MSASAKTKKSENTAAGSKDWDKCSATSKSQADAIDVPQVPEKATASQVVNHEWASKTSDESSQIDNLHSFAAFEKRRKAKIGEASLHIRKLFQKGKSIRTRMDPVSLRNCLLKVIQAPGFETLVCLVIFCSVIKLGVEVELTRRHEAIGTFEVIELIFSAFFVAELLMKLAALGAHGFFGGKDYKWNCVDLTLVIVSVDFFMDTIMGKGSELHYARIIGLCRTVRILRVIRIMKFFRPLRILVYRVSHTLRSLFWTGVLLAMIIYVFGVIFTLAANQADLSGDEGTKAAVGADFGCLWATSSSLFKAMTGGVDWDVCTRALNALHPFYAVLFIGFVAFSHLAVLNVITGVVCQGAIESAQHDQDVLIQSQLARKETYVEQLKSIFLKLDSHESGLVSLQEFEQHMQDPSLQGYFAAMDITTNEASRGPGPHAAGGSCSHAQARSVAEEAAAVRGGRRQSH